MKIYDSRKPLISLHVPKCAGQSFRRVLEIWFGDKLRFHYFQQRQAPPPRHPWEPGICIHGHFNGARNLGVADYYPEADQFITVLRDPLEAAVSNYFYWKNKARDNQLRNGTLVRGGDQDYGDIDDFFRKRPKSNMFDFLPFRPTREAFMESFETSFVWVGMAERLQESVDGLAEILGFPKIRTARINVAPRDEDLSPALEEAFIENNALEFEIYRAWERKTRNPGCGGI